MPEHTPMGESQSVLAASAQYDYADYAPALPAKIRRGPIVGEPMRLFRYRVLKRIVDILLILLALPILVPLWSASPRPAPSSSRTAASAAMAPSSPCGSSAP